ncbi:MAG: Fic family protein [Polyangiaceae bacterium]|nr:Fic family protein [Polyangiaceae bacterium]
MAYLRELQKSAPADIVRGFNDRFDMSWIYHDSVLEGVVYTMDELRNAFEDDADADPSLIPVYDEIRNHKAAIDIIRELAARKRLSITLDVIKKLYTQLAPEEVEGKGPPKYRKDMPVHRLYFHDICTPDKISYRMRQLFTWINSAETKRSTHPVRLSAKAHLQMLQIYPFPRHSGKVARLLMNLVLLHHGYPPVIIPATERQRYYEALKTSDNAVAKLVNEALGASVETGIRYFEEAAGIATAAT